VPDGSIRAPCGKAGLQADTLPLELASLDIWIRNSIQVMPKPAQKSCLFVGEAKGKSISDVWKQVFKAPVYASVVARLGVA
jgi:hypothetical protein